MVGAIRRYYSIISMLLSFAARHEEHDYGSLCKAFTRVGAAIKSAMQHQASPRDSGSAPHDMHARRKQRSAVLRSIVHREVLKTRAKKRLVQKDVVWENM